MDRKEAEIEWIITTPVTGEQVPEGVKVWDAEGHECVISYHNEPGSDEGVLRFDGRYVYVGEDFAEFLAVADEVAHTGASMPYPVVDDGDPHDDHDCPKARFLDDPITRAYGVGGEMVGLISCPVCEEREAELL